ncbi:MAG: hypothetical protein JWM05_2574 [Acidimicrobiales bacterium]|nr:hypothetical protein [Acidimicrobiales bacterium]
MLADHPAGVNNARTEAPSHFTGAPAPPAVRAGEAGRPFDAVGRGWAVAQSRWREPGW